MLNNERDGVPGKRINWEYENKKKLVSTDYDRKIAQAKEAKKWCPKTTF